MDPQAAGDGVDIEMETDSKADFSAESSDNLPVKQNRVMKKAQRASKNGGTAEEAVAANGVQQSGGGQDGVSKHSVNIAHKSHRRRRHARGRVQLKKGGAGGKGVWGKPGSELNVSGVCSDVRDPNYDSDSQDEYKLVTVQPYLTVDQLDAAVKPIIEEYLEHGNTAEVEDLLSELNIGPNKHRIVRLAVMLAMDRHNAQRELTSQLVSDLYRSVFSSDDIARGFNELLSSIDDIVLDTPDAHNLLGQFIARSVADDCLPPKFITNYHGKVNRDHVRAALEKAEVLLSMNQGMAHLDNIWGCGGGNRPVVSLTNKIVELLKEYINSGDKNEAQRCLLELEVPHFHHELVYQACDVAIEDSSERVIDMMVQLLKDFTASAVVTPNEFDKGMRRMFSDIDDISVDVPSAPTLLEQIVGKLKTAGTLSNELAAELPSRGRKRFVSEGDGGKLKARLN